MLDLRERPADVMLTLFTAMGLLQAEAGTFSLTTLSREHLVKTSAGYIGRLMPLYGHRRMWDAFYDLASAVRSGTSARRS